MAGGAVGPSADRVLTILEAKTEQYQRNINQARQTFNSFTQNVQVNINVLNTQFNNLNAAAARTQQSFSRLRSSGSSLSSTLKGIAAAYITLNTVKSAQGLVDTNIRIVNSLKTAGLEGSELTRVYDELYASAQRNRTEFEGIAKLYSRVSLAQGELKVSTADLITFTDNVAKALRVAGTDTINAQGALLQLGQALGSGTVRAEEFNSILEGLLPIAQTAARGIKEAGGSVAQLRKLMLDGEVSSKAFFEGIQAGASGLDERLQGVETTVSGAFTVLNNALLRAAGEMNSGSQATEEFSMQIQRLARYIDNTNFSVIIQDINNFIVTVSQAADRVQSLVNWLSKLPGAAADALDIRDIAPQDRINTAFEKSEGSITKSVQSAATEGLRAAFDKAGGEKFGPNSPTPNDRIGATFGDLQGPKRTISIKDYPSTDSKGSKKKKGPRDRVDSYEDTTLDTESLEQEYQARLKLNPLLGSYRESLIKIQREQQLLNDLQRDNVEITPEIREKVSGLATEYARAEVALSDLSDTQDAVNKRLLEVREFSKDTTRGIVDGLLAGKDAAEVFGEALNKLGQKFLDLAFDSAFDKGGLLEKLFKGGSGGTGGGPLAFIGKLFGFKSGGYTGAGSPNAPAGVVHKDEYVFDKRAVDRIGVANLDAMRRGMRGYQSGGMVTTPSLPRSPSPSQGSVTFGGIVTNINIEGSADRRTLALTAAQIAENNRQILYQQKNQWRS